MPAALLRILSTLGAQGFTKDPPSAPQPPTQAPSMGAITYARANDSLDMLSGVRISCPKISGSPTAILK